MILPENLVLQDIDPANRGTPVPPPGARLPARCIGRSPGRRAGKARIGGIKIPYSFQPDEAPQISIGPEGSSYFILKPPAMASGPMYLRIAKIRMIDGMISRIENTAPA